MKFGRYLKDHQIAEWSRAYINYRALKKQIAKAEAELQEQDDREEVDARAAASGTPTTPNVRQQPATDALPHPDVEQGVLGAGDEADDEEMAPTAPKQRARPGWVTNPLESAISVQSMGEASSRIGGDSDGSGDSRTPFAPRRPSAASSQASRATNGPISRSNPQRQQSLIEKLSRSSTFLKGSGDMHPKNWRPDFPPSLTLPQLYDILPPACRKFFTTLDRELDRISSFYGEREDEAAARFGELSTQWKELLDHKKEFQAFRTREFTTPRVLAPIVSRVPTLQVPGSGAVRRTLARRPSPSRSDDGGVKAQSSAFLHGRPEDYQAAKSKLKLATFEYYRSLGMLKSYKVLNHTGFTKALKKFEKGARIPCAKAYGAKVDKANFVKSTRLDQLIRETEDAFASVFEHGDRKKALERLRELGARKMHHFTAWRSGLALGLGIPLLLEGIVKSCQASTREAIPYWPALLQLFGAMFLPILFTLMFYLNLAAWTYARINYVLIFELDIRTRMDHHQFIEIPSIMFFIYSLFFWASWSNFWPDHIPPSAYPLAFMVLALALLFMPLPYLYPSARWWMVRSFSRVLTAGLVRVEFRDFFLGDELNSLYYVTYNLGLLFCAYHHKWPANTQEVCSTNRTWASPVLAALPAIWRLGQSIRRYLDSDGLAIHALNAGKYTASILYFFLYFNYRIFGSHRDWRMALWILAAIINSSYTAVWDIYMDWSLGRRNTKHLFLRAELGFKEHIWIYYFALVADVLCRFSWVVYLPPQAYPSLPLRGFMVAILEVFRRIMWNGFRVESEHIGNVDGYRVTRNVPLPYVMPGSAVERAQQEEVDPDEGSTRQQRIFRFFHRLHSDIVSDFGPLVSINLPVWNTTRPLPHRTASTSTKKKDYAKRKRSRGTVPESSTQSEGQDETETPSEDDGSEDDQPDEREADDALRKVVAEADSIQETGAQAIKKAV